MSPFELANRIKQHLKDRGSIDAKVLDHTGVCLQANNTKAKCGVICQDKQVPELYKNDVVLSEMSCGNDEVFALPYGDHLVLIFDTRS